MSELKIANPMEIDFNQGLKNWFKLDNINKNSFWGRRAGMAAMATIAIGVAIIGGGIIMNLGAILFFLGALAAKVLTAVAFGILAFLVLYGKTRNYIKDVLVGFFESITLEYVRKHPEIAFGAYWSFLVDRINNFEESINAAKRKNKSLERDITDIGGRINQANGAALKAEQDKDEIVQRSYQNKALQLTEMRKGYIQLKQYSEGYIDNSLKVLNIAYSKKTAIENEIELYRSKAEFNKVSSDMISSMKSFLFPDSRILNMYREAKKSIDESFDHNTIEMDTLMERLNSMPSVEELQNPILMQEAISQFETWKTQNNLSANTTSTVAINATSSKPEENKKPSVTGEVDF